MTLEEAHDYAVSIDTDFLTIDGFDEAFLGLVTRNDSVDPIACYSRNKILDILIKRDAMDWEEASEYLEFNIAGAWVGPATPFLLD